MIDRPPEIIEPTSRRAAQVLLRRRPGRDRGAPGLRARPGRQPAARRDSSPTTPPRRSARSSAAPPSSASAWADPERRAEIIAKLAERGIDFDHLAETAGQPDADPFDLLCHLAFNAPLRTRRERAQRPAAASSKDFFDQYGPRRARSWTSCSKSTPTTARRSS